MVVLWAMTNKKRNQVHPKAEPCWITSNNVEKNGLQIFGQEKINLYKIKMKNFNQIFHLKCARKNCSDEYIGLIAMILSI